MSQSEIPRDRSINYVEFVVSSIQQAKIFYGSVFGWTFTDYGENYCEFSDGEMKGGFETGTPKPEGGALIVLYGHHWRHQHKRTLLTHDGGKTCPRTLCDRGGS